MERNESSGGDDNLLVSVSEYDPYLWSDNVRCFGSAGGPGIKKSCNGLADRMDTSQSLEIFGPGGMAHDYVTPYTLTACMSLALSDISYIVTIYSTNDRCYLTLKSGPNNLFMGITSWYEIWEVAILVNAMCIRAGKKGVFKILSVGKSKVLHAIEWSMRIRCQN